MSYSLTDTLPDYIGFARSAAPESCQDYDDYRPGDECPLHGCDSWAICGQCERHVTYWPDADGHATRVWGYRDPEPAWDGVMTSGPEWWCPECVASFGLDGQVKRCGECGDAFHCDMENVHGGACDDCRAKGD